MTKRVERIARKVMGDNAGIMTDALTWAGTYHGIGARLLREYAEQIGLDPAFTIHDREDSADLMNLVRHEKGFSKTESRFPTKGTCLSIYSRCVNAEMPIEQVIGTSYPWCAGWAAELKELFAAYVEAKQKQNVLDYDDLLLYWAQMVGDPGLADDIGGRFDHVLVDEYQDTNRLQSSILLALKPGGRGLTVVGDDAQSIYSFRAATVRNILDFPDQFSPPANIITLDRNYRSTQTILAAANGVIGLAKERFTKNLWTERTSGAKPQLVTVRDEADQARFIVERILENRESGTLLKEQAVLFRTSSHSGPLEIELTRRNIPFVKFGGLKFLDAAHIKDMLALLRFVENPRLVGLVADGDELRLGSGRPIGPEVFGKSLLRKTDDAVGGGENRLRRAIVSVDADDSRRRQRRHRSCEGAIYQKPLDRSDVRGLRRQHPCSGRQRAERRWFGRPPPQRSPRRTSRSAIAGSSCGTASSSTPLFESTINADFQHIIGGGLKLEYHLCDMLSIGVVGVSASTHSTPASSTSIDPTLADHADDGARASRPQDQFLDRLNSMPFHGAAYISLTPWYGKLAAFSQAYVAFDFYFQAGVSFAQLKSDCPTSVCTDTTPGKSRPSGRWADPAGQQPEQRPAAQQRQPRRSLPRRRHPRVPERLPRARPHGPRLRVLRQPVGRRLQRGPFVGKNDRPATTTTASCTTCSSAPASRSCSRRR